MRDTAERRAGDVRVGLYIRILQRDGRSEGRAIYVYCRVTGELVYADLDLELTWRARGGKCGRGPRIHAARSRAQGLLLADPVWEPLLHHSS